MAERGRAERNRINDSIEPAGVHRDAALASGAPLAGVASVSSAETCTPARDEHQVCRTGLLWRLLRHGEAGVGARAIRAPGGRPDRA